MDEYFAAMPITNATMLCIGGITRREAEIGQNDDLPIDGKGYYLFLADETEPKRPIQILAKFLTEIEAGHLARLFSSQHA